MNCHITNEFDENSEIFVGSIGKVTITRVDDGKTIQDNALCEAYISPDLDSFTFKSMLLKGEIYELMNQDNKLEIQITTPIFSAKKGDCVGAFIFKVPNAAIAINDRIEFNLSREAYHSFRVEAKDDIDTELIFKRFPTEELYYPFDENQDHTRVTTSENGVHIHVVEGKKTLDIDASKIYLMRTFLGRYYICNINTGKKIMRLCKAHFDMIRKYIEEPVK